MVDEPRRIIAERYAALPTEAKRRLLADLWTTRGWETAIYGSVVVATTADRSRRFVVDDDERTDDVERITPEAIAATLLYGIDRDDADRLCETHLDDSAAELVAATDSPERSTDDPSSEPLGPKTAALLVVVGLLVAAIATQPLGLWDAVGPSGDEQTVTPDEQTVTPVPDESTPRTAGSAVSGTLGPTDGPSDGFFLTGIHDIDRVATGHAASIDSLESVGVTVRVDGPAPPTTGNGTLELLIANETRFRIVDETGLALDGGDRVEAFADGTHEYRRIDDESVSYERHSVESAPSAGELGGVLLRTYLNTSESDLRQVVIDGEFYYRVEATGAPPALDGVADDYRAVALVTPNGTVTAFEARYAHEPTGEDVRIAFEYDRSGSISVSPPIWYPEAAEQ